MLVLAPLDVDGARERGPAVYVRGEHLLSRSVHEEGPAAPLRSAGIVDRLDELLLVGSPELPERPFQESAGQGYDIAACHGGDATVDSARTIAQREAAVGVVCHEACDRGVT